MGNLNVFKKENKGLKISLIILRNICLAALITLVAAFALGYKFLTVLTGSMTPTMPKNTVVVVKHIPIQDVQVGDVITYQTNSKANVTHRVVEIKGKGDNIALVTRGDAADGNDQNVTVENPKNTAQNKFVGVVVYYVKDLGVALRIIKENIIIIVVCVALGLFIVIYS